MRLFQQGAMPQAWAEPGISGICDRWYRIGCVMCAVCGAGRRGLGPRGCTAAGDKAPREHHKLRARTMHKQMSQLAFCFVKCVYILYIGTQPRNAFKWGEDV